MTRADMQTHQNHMDMKSIGRGEKKCIIFQSRKQ